MAEIKGVFFDLGGTLRIAYDLPSHQEKAKRRMAELAGWDDADAFLAMVEERYVPYRDWALPGCSGTNGSFLRCRQIRWRRSATSLPTSTGR